MNETEQQLRLIATSALKSIARNEQIKQHVLESESLYPLILRAARRFIAGETRDQALPEAIKLISKGYSVSLDCIGENKTLEKECTEAKNEFLQLVRSLRGTGHLSTMSLDLSKIGMMVDGELAYRHLEELLREASLYGVTIMISAEESFKTEQIVELYKRAAGNYVNVGITLQAHLHRTERDLAEIQHYPGRIRIVKGAYQESEDNGEPRSERLTEKYLRLVEARVASGHPVSIATHDEAILGELRRRGYLGQPNVEVEMLYGIRADLLKTLKDEGYRARVYLPYGKEWHLYFFHRLAEYPPNLYRAIADMVTPPTSLQCEY